MTVAISTVAFKQHRYTIEEIIETAKRHSWTIEFSSGLEYRADLADLYLGADIRRLPHNYFPPPKEAFVLNLASLNERVRKISVQHCIEGLKLASLSYAPFYSVHAGFCGDPRPEELGNQIRFESSRSRKSFWNAFTRSIDEVLEQADEFGVDLLVENNVCAPFNLTKTGENPFLCSDPSEILQLFNDIKDLRLGFLLDTGHLKVSSNSIGFDLNEAVDKVKPYTKAIHHSDNDGSKDDNQPLTTNYWFLGRMTEFRQSVHILEVKALEIETIEKQIKILTDSVI